eukprot:COSAG04_NODE_3252_length_3005_cov_473.669305_2_plen_121_part_00
MHFQQCVSPRTPTRAVAAPFAPQSWHAGPLPWYFGAGCFPPPFFAPSFFRAGFFLMPRLAFGACFFAPAPRGFFDPFPGSFEGAAAAADGGGRRHFGHSYRALGSAPEPQCASAAESQRV